MVCGTYTGITVQILHSANTAADNTQSYFLTRGLKLVSLSLKVLQPNMKNAFRQWVLSSHIFALFWLKLLLVSNSPLFVFLLLFEFQTKFSLTLYNTNLIKLCYTSKRFNSFIYFYLLFYFSYLSHLMYRCEARGTDSNIVKFWSKCTSIPRT